MNNIIYDFETLSQDTFKGVVVSLAILEYDESRFTSNPYEFGELVSMCKTIKFDIAEQRTKYNRVIDQSTLDWWKQQNKEAQKQLLPSEEDVSISELHEFIVSNYNNKNIKSVWTRGNTFDPVLFQSVMKEIGKTDPFDWWKIRDTRSFIDGILYGSDISNKFMPENLDIDFIHHDPCHDIAVDVMRMQVLIQALSQKD
jgi:hypothetical protein